MLTSFQLRATFVVGFMGILFFFFFQTASAQTCAPPPPGLVSFWPGDDTANDFQGTNHGTLENGAAFGAGQVGRAFSFDGVDDSVLVPSINIGSSFTVELWIFPRRAGGFQYLVANGYNQTNFGALYFVNNQLQYWQGNLPGGHIDSAPGSIALNAWAHVAVTYDGHFARLYINGNLAATSGDHVETFNNQIRFGYAVFPADPHFQGSLDEVSLYNRDLSAAELQSIASAGPAGKCIAPSLFINDASIPEGNAGTTNAVFTVSAVRHNTTVSVDYATANGAATAPADYQSQSGTLTFLSSSTSATITVPVNGDTTFEVDETFFVNLSNGTNATIVRGQGIGAIINEDCFSPPANMVAWWPGENNATDVQGGNNGTLENGVTFATGEVGQAFSFNTSNSVLTPTINVGSAFTVELWVFPTSNGAFQHMVSNSYLSANYGALYYTSDHIEYYQAGSPRIVSDPVPLNVWTHVALTYDGNVDRLYLNGGLVATSAIHSENFNNALRFGYSAGPSDNHFQGNLDEITLYSRALSAVEVQSLYSAHNTGKCSITPNILISDVMLTEGDSGASNAVFTVSLSHPIGSAVTVNYQTADGSATAPGDYQSQSNILTIPANTSSGTIMVPVNGDTTFELDENFFVNLSNATNAVISDSQGVGTIVNDDCFAPPPGLVAWWIAEGNANDAQGSNNGTLENGATFAAGKVGQAFSFDGLDDSVLVPSISAGTSFSIELWIFPTNNQAFQHLVSNNYNNGNYGALYFNSDHVTYYQAGDSRVTSGTLSFNAWTHVALTYDGSVDRLYINGNLVDTSATHAEVFNNALRFGYSVQAQDQHFQGRLDEISLYSRALTDTEVLSIYDSRTTGKCAGGRWTGATNSDWHNPGNWSSGMVPDANTDVTISANVNNDPVIGSADATVKSLTIASGHIINVGGGRTLTVNDTLTNGGMIVGPGGVAFSGASLVNSGTLSVANFNFTRAGSQTINGGGSFSSNTSTVMSGTTLTLLSDHQMSTLGIQSGGTIDITSRVLGLSGSLANGGTLTVGGSTIVANGTTPQTFTTTSYNSLTINNSSVVSLGSDATLGGTLTLTTDLSTGAFTLTMPNSGGSAGGGDVIGNLKRTGLGNSAISFGNPFTTIAITGGVAPTDVTVSLAKVSPQDFGNSVRRTYTITSNGGNGYSATLRLHYLDAEVNNNTEGSLQLWRKNGPAWTPQGAASRDATDNWVEVTNVTQFSPWTLAGPAGPTAAPAIITGRVTTATGGPVGGVLMQLSGAQSTRVITNSNGFYVFEGVELNGFYTVAPMLAGYAFAPASRSFSLLGSTTDAAFMAVVGAMPAANPLDTPEFFVRQQYLDFLNREPDQGGFEYWSGQINQCGNDPVCAHAKRIDVSNAFFYEAEFQESGAYVYRIYEAAFAQPPSYAQFSLDHGSVTGGPQLEQSKTAFATAFVQRAQFAALYPDTMTAAQYVDALNAKTGNILTQAERDDLVDGLLAGAETRATVLRKIADNTAFSDREYNRSFVLTQYFGYLRRDPDRAGFDFWLDQVNRYPLRSTAIQHAMVCSFITSAEYQLRFSSVVTHSNTECSPMSND